jgi:hypothetical protein
LNCFRFFPIPLVFIESLSRWFILNHYPVDLYWIPIPLIFIELFQICPYYVGFIKLFETCPYPVLFIFYLFFCIVSDLSLSLLIYIALFHICPYPFWFILNSFRFVLIHRMTIFKTVFRLVSIGTSIEDVSCPTLWREFVNKGSLGKQHFQQNEWKLFNKLLSGIRMLYTKSEIVLKKRY